MNKIVYYIWNFSIIALIVISIIPFSTGLSNVVLGVSIICGIISYKKLEISKKSKLLIVGNSFFASDLTVQLYSNSSNTSSQRMGISFYYNKDFLLNSVAYLTQRDESITIRKDIGIVPYTSTDKQDKIIKIIIVALPIVVIATGIVVWIIRKRKK